MSTTGLRGCLRQRGSIAPEAIERPHSIARNTLFGAATQLTTAAFTAVLTLYLVRALGPGDYGSSRSR